ncbi:MAG: DUF4291 domain-containing protein [Okeania sp. SIO3B3]|nr:DUF4291 domain-containing protein [Okeania sp. SIO3B3]
MVYGRNINFLCQYTLKRVSNESFAITDGRCLALSSFQEGVRLQWDPDHNPMGQKVERRAIQLGLRGEILRNYSRDWILKIENITEFVRQQRSNRESSKWINLITPTENVYPVDNSEIIYKLGLSIL